MVSHKGYRPLNETDVALGEVCCDKCGRHQTPSNRLAKGFLVICAGLFLVSSIFNVAILQRIYVPPNTVGDEVTKYAKLERNIPTEMGLHSVYRDPDETKAYAAWEQINIDAGTIALSDSYVDSMGLPKAQRFPWNKDKGVYLVNGFHNLHCTREIYLALMDFRRGLPQSREWDHIMHCLDQLRQDAICNADDTPRYTTSDLKAGTGVGQQRMCRSWNKMAAWAESHTACYRYVNQTQGPSEFPLIYRYLFCPEGSAEAREVDKVFPPVGNKHLDS